MKKLLVLMSVLVLFLLGCSGGGSSSGEEEDPKLVSIIVEVPAGMADGIEVDSSIDLSTFTITAKFDDNSEKTISVSEAEVFINEIVVTDSFTPDTVGELAVRFVYQGIEGTATVQILEKTEVEDPNLVSLAVEIPSDLTNGVEVDSSIDLSTFIVRAVFDNDTQMTLPVSETEILINETVVTDSFTPDTVGDLVITFAYQNVEGTATIQILEKTEIEDVITTVNLVPSNQEIDADGTSFITFDIMVYNQDEELMEESATLYLDEVEFTEDNFSSTMPGTYVFYAMSGDVKSNEVTITVNPLQLETPEIILSGATTNDNSNYVSEDGNATITITSLSEANIFYSLDGSEPTTEYTEAIIIPEGNYEIKAVAKKENFLDSVVMIMSISLTKETPAAKKVLMYIAPENFADDELFKPREIFMNNGIEVTVASNSVKLVNGQEGGSINSDIAIADVDYNDYDLFVVVGGQGIYSQWTNQSLIDVVTDAYNAGKYVSAICAAPPVLANAGILNGVTVTCFPDQAVINQVTAGGAIYSNQTVIDSGQIVTGKDPSAATEFGQTLLTKLAN